LGGERFDRHGTLPWLLCLHRDWWQHDTARDYDDRAHHQTALESEQSVHCLTLLLKTRARGMSAPRRTPQTVRRAMSAGRCGTRRSRHWSSWTGAELAALEFPHAVLTHEMVRISRNRIGLELIAVAPHEEGAHAQGGRFVA